jgi:hypothetical protein
MVWNCGKSTVKNKQLEDFIQKIDVLSQSHVKNASEVTMKYSLGILSQTIPYVGSEKMLKGHFVS